MEFIEFRNAIRKQFREMQKYPLYVADTDKEKLWEVYLDSFSPENNPFFRERTEHDCQCCKQFIRSMGNVIAITNEGRVISLWDVPILNYYQDTANALSAYVKKQKIRNIFLKSEHSFGIKENHGISPLGNVETFNHFQLDIPNAYVIPSESLGIKHSEAMASFNVFARGLKTITLESIEIVLDLISQNSIYRGEEHKDSIVAFKKLLIKSKQLDRKDFDIFAWKFSSFVGARIRNTMIGTLLVDISDNVDLEVAVSKFESKAAPENYKRPKALVTKRMITDAQKTVYGLGLQKSLPRRAATIDDLTINNVLFADKAVKKSLDVFDDLKESFSDNTKELKYVEEISTKDFMEKVLPTASKLELLFDSKNINNLVSLIAPENADAPNITKWENNFSWSYNGEVADSLIKDKVKSLGGGTVGPLRFSINWAEGDWSDDNSDLDAWAKEPNGVDIGFNTSFVKTRNKRSPCSGQLDIDIQNPSGRDHNNIVENIIWIDKSKMLDGKYFLKVHQYQNHNSKGFKAEVEFDGKIYTYIYDQPVYGNINVAIVTLKDGEFSIKHKLPIAAESVQEHWNIATNKFHTVKTLMYSPNHWDDKGFGNRHYFFMLENCLNPDPIRGFYNEFLPESLTKHRKVFELLGSKMRADYSDQQLSGLGFSTTKKGSIICRVSGSFSRVLKIVF